MADLFLTIVNMSICASWLVLAVLILRLLLKNAPKWVSVLLWGLVAVRLLCPFSPESPLSLIPSGETFRPEILTDPIPAIQSGIQAVDSAVNPILGQSLAPASGFGANPLQIWISILSAVWIVGVAVMVSYAAVSDLRLRSRVKTAVRLRDNLFQSERIASAFILGIFRPRIYLPFGMAESDMAHVISHELSHLRRKDHWWKPLGFALLALHWFNPLLWIAYALLCRDIELACDEKVIRNLGTEQRADYSQTLLSCSVSRGMICACPLAFGEVGVTERVKKVLHYKKPPFWIVAAAILACAVMAVCFLTNPATDESLAWARKLSAEDVQQIELTVLPQDADGRICSAEEWEGIVSLINQSGGRQVAKPEALNGQSLFFDVTLKDGTVRRVGNIGNHYLVIDGHYYEAEYAWLSAWADSYGGKIAPMEPADEKDQLQMALEEAADDIRAQLNGLIVGWNASSEEAPNP